MSSPLAIANAAVAVHSDSNAPAVSASSAANASLCMKSPHRPAPQPAIGRLPYAPGAGGRPNSPIAAVGGSRLPPASDPAETIAISDPRPSRPSPCAPVPAAKPAVASKDISCVTLRRSSRGQRRPSLLRVCISSSSRRTCLHWSTQPTSKMSRGSAGGRFCVRTVPDTTLFEPTRRGTACAERSTQSIFTDACSAPQRRSSSITSTAMVWTIAGLIFGFAANLETLGTDARTQMLRPDLRVFTPGMPVGRRASK